ncbi:predicted protein [Arabidopsis lyrata subsp. lyrata]|uniref:Predicted protein n=1 Tax=Arabidopsis lyrata subsp. lyrata TaxID=81972 RepID=D7MU56_ARALL|nr:predicted protein [Arabidopsis lyrata subsp. lyrata]
MENSKCPEVGPVGSLLNSPESSTRVAVLVMDMDWNDAMQLLSSWIGQFLDHMIQLVCGMCLSLIEDLGLYLLWRSYTFLDEKALQRRHQRRLLKLQLRVLVLEANELLRSDYDHLVWLLSPEDAIQVRNIMERYRFNQFVRH